MPPQGESRRCIGAWMLVVMASIAAVFGLRALAHAQLDAYLLQKAQSRLAVVQQGRTPYRWELRDSRDLIAGRVFGLDRFDFDADGLSLRSVGLSFEIGLPLNNEVIDFQRFDRLRLRLITPRAMGACELVVREALGQPEIKAPMPLRGDGSEEELRLAALAWVDEHGHSTAAPKRAAALRIRAKLDAGQPFHLDWLAFLPASALSAPGLIQRSVATWHRLIGVDDVTTIAPAPSNTLPLFTFPTRRSNEATLALNDRLRQAEPAALLIADRHREALAGSVDPTALIAIPNRPLQWTSLVALAAILLAIRFAPPRDGRWRAGLELAGVIVPALGIVVGGWLGNDLELPVAIALLLVAAFALSLAPVKSWDWTDGWRGWLLPASAVIVAIGIALAFGDHLKLRGAMTLFRYVSWTLLQEYLLCVVLTDRLMRLGLDARVGVPVAATLFALLHTPNETLMLATFVGGMIWVSAWLRHRRLLPIVVTHALAALILFCTLPTPILRSAEVSARFFLS